MFKKGDILEATYRELTKGYHYIIYYEGFSQSDFIGGMITHSDINQNVKMTIDHFEVTDFHGKPYKIGYDNTYLVLAKLVKPEVWGPYRKVGELSAEGIIFFEDHIGGLRYETFANYYKKHMNK